MYKFDLLNNKWVAQDQLPNYHQKFLFFASVCHLPKSMGMFILGGSDVNDNFSRKSTLFSKYQRYVEKPSMLY